LYLIHLSLLYTLFPYTTLFRSCLNIIIIYYNGIDKIIYYATNPGRAYEYIKFIKKYPELSVVNKGLGSFASIILTLTVGTKYIRSEEHTSELQSREKLVCRLLL